MRKLTINDACAIARKRGGLCLSTEYINANILMRWRCADGHKWTIFLNNIKNDKTWCPYYANKASHTISKLLLVRMENAFPKCMIIVFYLYHGVVLKGMSGMHLLTM